MSCLFSREEFDLLGLLRTGADDDELVRLWREAMWAKPRAHGMDHAGLGAVALRDRQSALSERDDVLPPFAGG